MKVFMTGGTGLLGRALCQALLARGDQVWVYSRRPQDVPAVCGAGVRGIAALSGPAAAPALECDVWVNLAGEPIAGGRWTAARQKKLRDSRIAITQQLMALIQTAGVSSSYFPRAILSGSAIGIYGNTGANSVDETNAVLGDETDLGGSKPAPGFAAALCRDWESAALELGRSRPDTRLLVLRTGLVMSPDGGLWPQLKRPAQMGLAARLGDGQQYQSWIHIADWVRAVLALMDAGCHASGAINLTAPQPLTQIDFTRQMARALRRPQWLCVPAAPLRLALGEMADLVLHGQRVLPARLLAEGPPFLYPDWDSALAELTR